MEYYRVITPGTTLYVESNLSENQTKNVITALFTSVENITKTTMLEGQVYNYSFKIK